MSPYRPQANGQIERIFRTIRPLLVAVAHQDRHNWPLYLPYVTHAYNTAYHSTILNTPFFLMHGRDPNPLSLQLGEETEEYVEPLRGRTQMLQQAFELVRKKLTNNQNRSKEHYDQKLSATDYQINDVVMVKCQQVPKDSINKLYPKYVGPYRIKSIQHETLGLVPLKQPGNQPRPLHADNVRRCSDMTVLKDPLEDLLRLFTDPA